MRFLSLLLLGSGAALSGSPPSNSIPVIAMKSGQDSTMCDITLDFLCMLSWHYFDGIEIQGWTGCEPMTTVADLCDRTGMYATVSPMYLGHLGDLFCDDNWARGSAAIGAVNAFVQSSDSGESITAAQDAAAMRDKLIYYCRALIDDEGGWETLWYYDTWNEAPAWQRNRMISESFAYDDYYPGMFTQDTSMSEVLDTGVWSWTSWMLDSLGSEHPLTSTFSTMHKIYTWAGYQTLNYPTAPTFHTQANSVRAFIGMEYQEYDPTPPAPGAVENRPRLLGCNAYPFRLVGSTYEDTTSVSVLGDSLHTWMLEHYEEGLDSTIVVAALEDHFPVHYHPQAFGLCGGEQMWVIDTIYSPPDTSIGYASYRYRIPSPAEFRMLCNLALLRQAKGVFPYSVRGYSEEGACFAGLLDEDLIPWDAPYEEWVYGERPTDDFSHAPPDCFPPFRDGFDPLFELAPRPTTSGARARQDYLEWKFGPYASLWHSMRETLGEIAWIAPELSGLWWWDGGYIEWGVGGLLGLKGGPGTASEAWSGFGEGWSKGGQGVINDFTGGLFDSQYGLFYDSFDKLDKDAFGSGIKCDSAFKFGSNAGRVAEGSLLAAGAVWGAFYAPGTSIFYSGSAAEAEALSMAAAGEGSTILNTLGGRFLVWTGTRSQFLWGNASSIYASVSSSEAVVLVGASGGSTLGTIEIPILVQNGVRLIVYTVGF